jgi:hypothetical protein
MTQVVLNINSKEKWNALKDILETMNIDYTAQDNMEAMNEKELELLTHAKNDDENGKVHRFISHRAILGRDNYAPIYFR